jgi:hypothetical protein
VGWPPCPLSEIWALRALHHAPYSPTPFFKYCIIVTVFFKKNEKGPEDLEASFIVVGYNYKEDLKKVINTKLYYKLQEGPHRHFGNVIQSLTTIADVEL